jgi:chromosome segregation ATPase
LKQVEESLRKELDGCRTSLNATIRQLENQLEENKEKAIFLSGELRNKDNSLLQTISLNNTLNEKVRDLEIELSKAKSAKNTLELSLHAEIEKIKSELNNSQSELKRNSTENDKLNDIVKQAKKETEEITRAKDQMISTVKDNNEKKLKEKNDIIKELQDNFDELRQQVTNLKQEKTDLTCKLNDLVHQSDNKDKQLIAELMGQKDQLKKDHLDEISQLKRQLNDASTSLERTKCDLTERNKELSNLSQTVLSKDDQIKRISAEKDKTSSEIISINSKLSLLQATTEKDKATISRLETENQRLTATIDSQASDLERARTVAATAKESQAAEQRAFEAKLVSLATQLEAEVDGRQRLDGEVAKTRKLLAAAETQAENARKEADNLRLKIQIGNDDTADKEEKERLLAEIKMMKDAVKATEERHKAQIEGVALQLKESEKNLQQELVKSSQIENELMTEKQEREEEREMLVQKVNEMGADDEGIDQLTAKYHEVINPFLAEAMELLHITEDDLNLDQNQQDPTHADIVRVATSEILRRAQDLYAALVERTQEFDKLNEEYEKLAKEKHHLMVQSGVMPANSHNNSMEFIESTKPRVTADKVSEDGYIIRKDTGSFIVKADSEEIDQVFIQQIEKLQAQNNDLNQQVGSLMDEVADLRNQNETLVIKLEGMQSPGSAAIGKLADDLEAERVARKKAEDEVQVLKASLDTAHDEIRRNNDALVKAEDKCANAEYAKEKALKTQGELRDKFEALKVQREKEETKFIEKLDGKLKDINKLNDENEKLAEKLRNEKMKAKKFEETLRLLQEKYDTEVKKTTGTDPEQPRVESRPRQTGSNMAEIKETEELDESYDKQHQGLNKLQNKIESLQLNNRSLKAKLAAFQKIFQSTDQNPEDLETEIGKMSPEEIKLRFFETSQRNMQLEDYLQKAMDHISEVERECQQLIAQELAGYNLRAAEMTKNIEELEERYARDMMEKTKTINKMKEELEEKVSAKDREIFYLRKEFETSNVAKEDELHNLRRIATEQSKERIDTNNRQEAKDYFESQPNQESSFNHDDIHSQERPKSSNVLEGAKRSTDRRERDIQVWKDKCTRLMAELEELKKKRDASLQIDNLTHVTSDVHITGPNKTPRSAKPAEDYDSLKQENEYLRQTNTDLRKDLERELDVRRQILQEHEYMRTDSDYRITNEDFEALKQEKGRHGTQSDEGTLYNELLTLYELKCGDKKPANRDSIVPLIAKYIDSLKQKDEKKPQKGSSEELEELRIDNQQLRKQVDSLNTQNDHLKDILRKNKDNGSATTSAQKPAQSLASKSSETETQVLEILNQFLKDMELQPMDKLESAKLKPLFSSIIRLKRKLLVELKAKDELIEELKLSSLKVSSERGEAGGTQVGSSQQEEYQRQKDLLSKYHTLRRKYENCLSEIEQLQIDKENNGFEVEDLRKTAELETKRREALEIQLTIIKQEATSGAEDMKAHIKKLFVELFKSFTDSQDQYQTSQILEYLTSMIGYSTEERKGLFENLKKKKFFEKLLKKK